MRLLVALCLIAALIAGVIIGNMLSSRAIAQTAGFIEYRYDAVHKVGIFLYKAGNGVAMQVIPEALLANPERSE